MKERGAAASESVRHAREWAIEKHGDQKYGKGPDAKPYAYHLGAVAAIAAPYGEVAEVVAWLHDVVEDTRTTEEQVRAEFGDRIARLVAYLTDEPGESRAARKARTNEKLAAVPEEDWIALVVKASDRLANLRESVKPGEKSEWMLVTYRDEHAAFREAAFRPGLCDGIWAEIDGIIDPLRNA